MRTGHLFAGGGGGLYADLILGHQPVFAVEWNPYACAVLRSRAGDGWFPGLRVHEGDVRLFDPSEYASQVDCIHAGFPCQDISPAGRGAGIHGERSGLYREVLRVAGILRPRYLFLENSAAILGRGLGTVLGDLAELGYDARWTVLAAAEVGAPHQRDRWWCLARRPDAAGRGLPELGRIGSLQTPGSADADDLRSGAMAYANCARREERQSGPGWSIWNESGRPESERRSGHVADAGSTGLQKPERETVFGERWRDQGGTTSECSWWSVEPNLGRVVNGLAHRSHQIRTLGNGQVSLCAAVAWKILGGM